MDDRLEELKREFGDEKMTRNHEWVAAIEEKYDLQKGDSVLVEATYSNGEVREYAGIYLGDDDSCLHLDVREWVPPEFVTNVTVENREPRTGNDGQKFTEMSDHELLEALTVVRQSRDNALGDPDQRVGAWRAITAIENEFTRRYPLGTEPLS